MSFSEDASMSGRLSYGFRVVPRYNTEITPKDNGGEQRNIKWTRAKRKFTARNTALDRDQIEELVALFHAVYGAGHSFRFKDWSDFKATMTSIGTTPGANTTAVQLVKTYSAGSLTPNQRVIKKPRSGTITVYQDDGAGNFVAKAGTTDTTTGLFTPDTNWTASRALKATFEFDVPVRFADDELPIEYMHYPAIFEADVNLIEDFLV